MKKNVLALSISAALCGLGMVGSAHAIIDLGVTNTIGNATVLKANNDGIGHNLIVPYYTAQGKNATAFTLTNTTSIAKAVKIRFRGAENSDDVLDFQVFLSPFDVWTASVSQSTTGQAMITTTDKSCTKPAFTSGVGQNFLLGRLSSATNVAGTREGYIEIFNMADAPGVVAGSVGRAVTHVAGVPTCTGAGFVALDAITDQIGAFLLNNAVDAPGLALPTTGLTANWIIINTTTGTSWSGQAQATQALNGTVPGTGNLVYWPQLSTAVVLPAAGNVNGLTADPLLQTGGLVAATMQDLPDMSTPYITNMATAAVGAATFVAAPAGYAAAADAWASHKQAAALSASLAVMSVNNDFYVDAAIGGASDWVFSMPTRRYNMAVNYAAAPAARVFTNNALSNTGIVTAPVLANYFTVANTSIKGNVACTSGISPTVYNREEGSVLISTSTTFSPSTAPAAVSFCGEVGVWALGQTLADGGFTGVVTSGIPNVAQTVGVNNYSAGWMNVATPGIANIGLPILGTSFSKASSDPAKTYGWSQPHVTTRIVGYAY